MQHSLSQRMTNITAEAKLNAMLPKASHYKREHHDLPDYGQHDVNGVPENGFHNDTLLTSGTSHTSHNGSINGSICDSHPHIMGDVFHNASPYLYPCTIEYSLICAAILFVMWKNVGHGEMNDE